MGSSCAPLVPADFVDTDMRPGTAVYLPPPLHWWERFPSIATALIAAGVVILLLVAAKADEAPAARVDAAHAAVAAPAKKAPDYVPIVVDKSQYDAVLGHLNGMRFGDALPLVKWLTELEDRARRQWEADNNPKPADPPK